MPDVREYQSVVEEAEQAARAGDFARADLRLRDALRLQETSLGADHPDLASTLNNLAVVCETLGQFDDAELFYRRAYAIASGSLPPGDPLVVTSRENLKDFCTARGLPLEEWPEIGRPEAPAALPPSPPAPAAPAGAPPPARPPRAAAPAPAQTPGVVRGAGARAVAQARRRRGGRAGRHRRVRGGDVLARGGTRGEPRAGGGHTSCPGGSCRAVRDRASSRRATGYAGAGGTSRRHCATGGRRCPGRIRTGGIRAGRRRAAGRPAHRDRRRLRVSLDERRLALRSARQPPHPT
jgi:hypothetical protein